MELREAIGIAEENQQSQERRGKMKCQCIDCEVQKLLLAEVFHLRDDTVQLEEAAEHRGYKNALTDLLNYHKGWSANLSHQIEVRVLEGTQAGSEYLIQARAVHETTMVTIRQMMELFDDAK